MGGAAPLAARPPGLPAASVRRCGRRVAACRPAVAPRPQRSAVPSVVVAAAGGNAPYSSSGPSTSAPALASTEQLGAWGREMGYNTHLSSKFIQGSTLGTGSFGVVYLGINLESGKEVALKVLPKQRAKLTRERTCEKLAREVHILQRLQHCPNVVQLVDTFEDDTTVCLVMELLSGGDLQKVSDTVGPFNERGLALVAQEVLKVIKACHEQGVLHGDVKPANFCLRHKSRTPLSSADPALRQTPWLKAIDFGCSQVFRTGNEPARRLSKRTGTPVYMAPEIFARDYSVEADVWSTGVMLYQLFSRQFPFWEAGAACRATNLDDIADAVSTAEIKYDYGPWLAMSEEGLDFVQQCLVRDPSRRLTVAEALRHPWFARMLPQMDERVYGGAAAAAAVGNNIVPSPASVNKREPAAVPAPAA